MKGIAKLFMLLLLLSLTFAWQGNASEAVAQGIDIKHSIFSKYGLSIPHIWALPESGSDHLVFVFHGYSSAKESNESKIRLLAKKGMAVLAMDAPYHGKRKNAEKFDELAEQRGPNLMIDIALKQTSELRHLITHFQARGFRRFSILGVSMGGIGALVVGGREPRISNVVSILGSPDWRVFGDWLDRKYESINPILNLDDYADQSVFAISAGLDRIAPAKYSEAFIDRLKSRFPERASSYSFLEYPESEHFMREQDWQALWSEVTNGLTKTDVAQ